MNLVPPATSAAPADERLTVRHASPSDVQALADLKPPAAIHRDRLRDADLGGIEYLVVEAEKAVIAFALLVFRRPASWPDANDATRLPGIVDIFVLPKRRGRGVGSFLMQCMESRARERGYSQLYLGVDPIDNPRALALYERLGYRRLQEEPRREHWRFVDSDGQAHEWNEWTIDMAKRLVSSQD